MSDTKLKTLPVTSKSLYEDWQQRKYGNIYPEFVHPFALTYDELKNSEGNVFSNNLNENI